MKYYTKPINQTDSVSYYTLDKDGNKIVDYVRIACYAHISMNNVSYETTSVHTIVGTNSLPYNENSVIRWIETLKSWGFNVEYALEGNNYHFTIPVSFNDKINVNRLEFNLILILVRYLWHAGFNDCVNHFFEMHDELPEEDSFKLFLAAHTYIPDNYANSNHMIRDYWYVQSLFSISDLRVILKNYRGTIDKTDAAGVTESLKGLLSSIRVEDLPQKYSERFKILNSI